MEIPVCYQIMAPILFSSSVQAGLAFKGSVSAFLYKMLEMKNRSRENSFNSRANLLTDIAIQKLFIDRLMSSSAYSYCNSVLVLLRILLSVSNATLLID